MKKLNFILKPLLSLIMLMPILGVLHIFPEPTADMYGTSEAFTFITAIMDSGYILYVNALVFALALVCLWTNRVHLGALLILPITVNIVGFHAFVDSGLFTSGAIMGNVLLFLNLYFLYQERTMFSQLLSKKVTQ